jgi:hypothetical protein
MSSQLGAEMVAPQRADRVAAVSLGPLSLLGNGGQGSVHAVRHRPGTAYKEYSTNALAELDDSVLEAMVRFPAELPRADAVRLPSARRGPPPSWRAAAVPAAS